MTDLALIKLPNVVMNVPGMEHICPLDLLLNLQWNITNLGNSVHNESHVI